MAITLDDDVRTGEATPAATDGGFVEATPAPPQGIAAMRLYEVWDALGRYKPVAAVLAALVVAAIVLPGVRVIENGGGAPYASTADAAVAGTTAPTAVAGDAGVLTDSTDASAADASATDTSLAVAPVELSSAPATTAPSASAATTTFAAGPPAAAASEPAPTTSPAAAVREARTDPTFKVRELGWATAQAGTPVSTAGIPEGGMPVAKRLGDVDKISFVRLSGSSNVLTVALVDDPTATRLADGAGVRACRITETSWKAQTGMALDQAPSYDKSACAIGKANADGTWTFNLGGFDEPADARGFALVPTVDAASDFQVVFAQT